MATGNPWALDNAQYTSVNGWPKTLLASSANSTTSPSNGLWVLSSPMADVYLPFSTGGCPACIFVLYHNFSSVGSAPPGGLYTLHAQSGQSIGYTQALAACN